MPINPARGYDELEPYVGQTLSVVKRTIEYGRCIDIVGPRGEVVLRYTKYDVPLKAVQVGCGVVVPEPLVPYAIACLVGELDPDQPRVSVRDCQDADLASVPDWALSEG
jgi:hypothetical protein